MEIRVAGPKGSVSAPTDLKMDNLRTMTPDTMRLMAVFSQSPRVVAQGKMKPLFFSGYFSMEENFVCDEKDKGCEGYLVRAVGDFDIESPLKFGLY